MTSGSSARVLAGADARLSAGGKLSVRTSESLEAVAGSVQLGLEHGDTAVLLGADQFGPAGQFLLPDAILGQTPHQGTDRHGKDGGTAGKKTEFHTSLHSS